MPVPVPKCDDVADEDGIRRIVERSSSEQIAATAESWNVAGDGVAAIRLLEAATSAHPSHGGLFHNLGIAKYDVGDFVGAIAAFTSALSVGYPSFVSRGLAQEQLSEMDSARADYLAALARDGSDIDALINLGTLELTEGRPAEAALRLAVAASIDPQANWQLADAYIARHKVAEARTALWKANDAGELRAYLDLARLEMETVNSTTLESYFERAIAANSSLARRELVVYLDNAGETQRALQVALGGVEHGDTKCYAPLGVIYESLGDLELAARYYGLAVKVGEEVYRDDLNNVLARIASGPRH